MAPKRKAKRADSEEDAGELSEDYEPSVGDDDSGSDYALEDEEDDEDVKPKKKKAPAKKAPAAKAPAKRTPAKKKAKAGSDDDEAGSSGKGKAKAKAAPKRPKPQKITEPTTLDDGWTLHPPSLLYKTNPKAQGGTKIACFDFDGTLVGTKFGGEFPRSADDWRWFSRTVPNKLRELHQEGYQLLVISNQGGVKSALAGAMSEKVRGRADQMVATLNREGPEVPVQVLMATNKDEYRKPERGMWDFFVQHMNAGVAPDIGQSFFCGDMAGREGDKGDGQASDREFANNVGLRFSTPEEHFGKSELNDPLAHSTDSAGKNDELATVFRKLAEIVAGEHFKVAAYKKVADAIDAFPHKITSAAQLKNTPGVGKSSLAKITEWLTTGTLAMLEEAGVGVNAPPEDKKAEVGLKFI
jgi:bifunctional polynucleotide phosphatase/kinase